MTVVNIPVWELVCSIIWAIGVVLFPIIVGICWNEDIEGPDKIAVFFLSIFWPFPVALFALSVFAWTVCLVAGFIIGLPIKLGKRIRKRFIKAKPKKPGEFDYVCD